jgi:hypothetical protein
VKPLLLLFHWGFTGVKSAFAFTCPIYPVKPSCHLFNWDETIFLLFHRGLTGACPVKPFLQLFHWGAKKITTIRKA